MHARRYKSVHTPPPPKTKIASTRHPSQQHQNTNKKQMKARLLWAARSPLRQHDALFRTALNQLNALLVVCTASFALQVKKSKAKQGLGGAFFLYVFIH
jgi:hypothetical protein